MLLLGAILVAAQSLAAQPTLQSTTNTGVIAGRVTTPDGQPVAGATVDLRGAGGSLKVATDSKGRYVFTRLPDSTYRVRPSRTGYVATRVARVQLVDGQNHLAVPVELAPLSSISGTVVDRWGAPVVGAVVQALTRVNLTGMPILAAPPGGLTVTDDRGRYRIANLPSDEYVVTAAPGPVSISRPLLDLLPPPPLTSAGIAARMDAGRVYPTTFHPGRTRASDATWIALGTADDRVGVDISMTPTTSVSVTGALVAPPDVLAQPFDVSLIAAGDLPEASMIGAIEATSLTADGRFRFSNVPAGNYTIMAAPRSVDPERPLLLAAQPVSVGPDDLTDLAVPLVSGSTVRGRLDFVGNAPIPTASELSSFTVQLFPVDLTPSTMARAGTTGRVGYPATVDATGQFTIEDVIPGRYRIAIGGKTAGWSTVASVATSDGIEYSRVALVGASAVTRMLVTVTNPDTATIVATLTFDAYADPSQTRVVTFPSDPSLWREASRWPADLASPATSGTGTVKVQVPPGDYVVAAIPPGGPTFWTSVRYLKQLSARGVRVTVDAGETKTVALPSR